MPAVQETVDQVRRIDVDQYKYGFVTDHRIRQGPEGPVGGHRPLHLGEEERAGVDAGVAARRLSPLADHARADLGAGRVRPIDFQDLYYYSAPKKKAPKTLDEVDPEILRTYEKLGIPLREREALLGVQADGGEDGAESEAATAAVAVDAVFDSVSVVTTFQEELKKAGVIFCRSRRRSASIRSS